MSTVLVYSSQGAGSGGDWGRTSLDVQLRGSVLNSGYDMIQMLPLQTSGCFWCSRDGLGWQQTGKPSDCGVSLAFMEREEKQEE